VKCASRERGADYGVPANVVGDEEIRNVRGNPEPAPGEFEERFVHAVKGSFDVPRGKEDRGARLGCLLQGMNVLR
jgi:hypothetical protein